MANAIKVDIFVVRREFSGSYGASARQDWGYFYSSREAEKYLTTLAEKGYTRRELSVQWKGRGVRPAEVPKPSMVYCS